MTIRNSNSDQLLARLVQRVEGRYFGKYRGHVVDNKDPSDLGRITAQVPKLLGTESTGWCLPAFAYGGAHDQGFFALPDIGAGVWIEFEGGDLSYPIWTGTWFTGGDIPESAKAGKKVLKTRSGHKIILDDDAGTLEITDSNNNTITMNDGTVKLAAGSATTVVIDGPKIQLVANAAHPLVFGDELIQYLNQIVQLFQTHTHPGEVAGVIPVTPMPPLPVLPPPPPTLLSQKVSTG